ncbi:vWA domain-containing protein [Nocardioides plantarum]|uniref:VWA domain-containing protein n=1 Tax=Nocardioides plantarum TaxID=29299 RepID=A0ABV5KBW9_9ACTN|nr:vWA domain-containing protein [Nocardioides plantarum]
MTDQTLTHLYFLLDRSGSMQSIKSDIEGGFAAFVDEQRSAPGSCRVTLAQFDDRYEVVYADRDVTDVPALDLQPRSRTALHDAMGRMITDAGASLAALPEDRRPGTVIVAIMTDGLENASQEWNAASIKALVEQQTQQWGWTFMYLGADQDAVEVGTSLGVPAAQSMTYSRGKGREAMGKNSEKISQLRAARMTDAAAPMPAYTAQERADLAD